MSGLGEFLLNNQQQQYPITSSTPSTLAIAASCSIPTSPKQNKISGATTASSLDLASSSGDSNLASNNSLAIDNSDIGNSGGGIAKNNNLIVPSNNGQPIGDSIWNPIPTAADTGLIIPFRKKKKTHSSLFSFLNYSFAVLGFVRENFSSIYFSFFESKS